MSGSVFSLDACRSMIAMLDVSVIFIASYCLTYDLLQWDKSGSLNFAEFQSLLRTIATWKVSLLKMELLFLTAYNYRKCSSSMILIDLVHWRSVKYMQQYAH